MPDLRFCRRAIALLVLAAANLAVAADGPVPVRLESHDGAWQLKRGDTPMRIMGAGGDESREVLKSLGGNSFRTWGADDLEAQLDEAQALGLAVTIGIWIGHERHGFKYTDLNMVAEQ